MCELPLVWQVSVPVHMLLHEPQVPLVERSLQRPPQLTWLFGQHTPRSQLLPAPQATPQLLTFVEQWLLSLSGFTHTPLHSVWPGGQLSWHTPATHSSPGLQTVEQLPQWFWSVCVSTHEPPHDIVPPGHDDEVHTPALHTWFAAQTVVQLPQ